MVTIFIIRSKVRPLIEGNTWEPADHPSHPQPQRLTRNRTKEAVVGFTAIPRDVNSLTAQISSLITLSDYFSFWSCKRRFFGVGWRSLVFVQIFLYELLSRKGGNCLMIPKYIYLLNQVVMTVGLHVPWNS